MEKEQEFDLPEDFRVLEYPFHLGDLLGGTAHLDDAQFGAYMRLLIANIQAQARYGGLPDNHEVLRSYTRMGPAAYKKLWLLIGDKFVHENGKIYNKRVNKTVNEIMKKSHVNRAIRLNYLETRRTNVEQSNNESLTNHKTNKPNNQKNLIDTAPDSTPAKNTNVKIWRYRVLDKLTDKGRRCVTVAAPGLDIQHLAEVYDSAIAQGKMEAPINADVAFPAWCKGFYANQGGSK